MLQKQLQAEESKVKDEDLSLVHESVTDEEIGKIVSRWTGIPVAKLNESERSKTLHLAEELHKRVIGQNEGVELVTEAIIRSKAGIKDPTKPIGSFLFLGPTGVGKTELAKALAAELGIAFLRFDMSEYAEKHTVAKLIGAPAGYVGYEEGGLLTEEVRKHPHAVLLLDEIEKAHPDIFNVLLQVMDYATLSDNQGRKADFRNIVLIMTSNAGANKVGKSRIGFGSEAVNMDALTDAVKQTFQPEFRNRLSRIVLFRSMDEEMAGKITQKKLKELSEKMKNKKVDFKVSKEAVEYVRKAGITKEYGAREIDRVIAAKVKPLLAELLLFGRLKKGGVCALEVEDGELVVR